MTIIAHDFLPTSYWWEAAPVGVGGMVDLPARADVVVVGSGITGAHCALELARGGRSVVMLDADAIGAGSSTRNNGTIVPYLYLKQYQLEKNFGKELGAAIARTAVDSIGFLLETCKTLGIDAQIKSYDRYFLALTERHRAAMEYSARLQAKGGIDTGWVPISAQDLTARTGITGYAGGIFAPNSLAMHPGLYHKGVIVAAMAAGVVMAEHTPMTGFWRHGTGLRVNTPRGDIEAKNVVLATNGYTDLSNRLVRNRLMSIRIYMAATEPLPDNLRAGVFARTHLLVDSKTNITWVRPSPDGTRLLVGGRGGMGGDDPHVHARALHADLTQLIPDLQTVKISHCWYGREGFPLDLVPHVGEIEGVHYALGFCGVGMTVGGWLGNRLARKILGRPLVEHETPFDGRPFRRESFPGAMSLFSKAGVNWINLRDWWETRGRQKPGFESLR